MGLSRRVRRELRAQEDREEAPNIAPKRIALDPEADEFLRHLPPEPKRRVRAALDAIRAEPDAGKELHLELDGWRRARVGGLRIVYRVAADIEVLAIGARETIYEEAARLIKAVQERRGRYLARRRRSR